jgi:hypothetical protein
MSHVIEMVLTVASPATTSNFADSFKLACESSRVTLESEHNNNLFSSFLLFHGLSQTKELGDGEAKVA